MSQTPGNPKTSSASAPAVPAYYPFCHHCGAPPDEHEVRSYDPTEHEGEVWCRHCQGFVGKYRDSDGSEIAD